MASTQKQDFIEYETIKCLVCNCPLSDKIYEYDTSLLFGKSKYPIRSSLNLCAGCGLIFNSPRLTEKSLEWLYSTSYGADTALYGSGPMNRLDAMRVDFIKKHIGTFRNIIDVGCGGGSLLHSFKQQGKEVHGIEPSAYLREYAKTNYDLDLLDGVLDQKFAKKNISKYDLVVFNEVLEHVYNPVEFLRLAAVISKGSIYFDVPNTLKPRYWNIADFFSCEHLTHFTKYSIKRLAQSLGFDVVAIEEDSDDPVIKVVLKKDIVGESSVIFADKENELKEVHQSFEKYKSERGQSLRALKDKLSGITDAVIYGAGHHTIQMIENGLLDGITIRDIVDSNSAKHGKEFVGRKIKSPKILADCSYPVVISTFGSQHDVANFIAREFPKVHCVKLYHMDKKSV